MVGVLAGPVFGILDPQLLLGELFFPFVSMSVAIILFEGSLTLKIKEILGLQKVVRNMVSIGMLVTWLITTLATRFALDLSWQVCFLFGQLLRRHWLPEFLHNISALALVLGCFTASNLLQDESGLVTVTVMGIWLGVAEPEPKGFLIVGANDVARAIAHALIKNGLRIQLAETSWDYVAKAKMEGLPVYLGNPVSEHAERHLNLVGIGRMLALSPHDGVNLAAALHYRMELGKNNSYTFQSKPGNGASRAQQVSTQRRGKVLFGEEITYGFLALALAGKASIKTTRLTETFGFAELLATHNKLLLPLFAIDPRERIHIFCAGETVTPDAG